jgi:hypothetical protein
MAWSGAAGEVVLAVVDDTTGAVTQAWTGPQVAWSMARGNPGAFGGKTLLNPFVWIGFCFAFLLGLGDLRRPLSMRNLDLLVVLGFSVSLVFFQRGEIFRSVPLVYPVLLYLLVRGVWIGRGRRGPALRSVWPTWALAAVAVFLLGFRIGLNLETPRGVIDVGLAGVVGADRILHGEAPYGNMPTREGKPCGPADAEGQVRDHVQTNGRCEAEIERGDTYGPVSYLAYVPATAILGWSGRWDSLPAGHATSIAFDLLTLLGLVLVGRRFGGNRLAVLLAFAWVAYPFTAYTLNANTNDAIMPAFLVLGFWLVSSAWARGASVALAGWTKFASLLVAPLWAPSPRRASSPSRSCSSSRAWYTRSGRSGSAPSATRQGATPPSRSGAGGSTTRAASRISASSNRWLRRSRSCSRSCSRSGRGARARWSSPRSRPPSSSRSSSR